MCAFYTAYKYIILLCPHCYLTIQKIDIANFLFYFLNDVTLSVSHSFSKNNHRKYVAKHFFSFIPSKNYFRTDFFFIFKSLSLEIFVFFIYFAAACMHYDNDYFQFCYLFTILARLCCTVLVNKHSTFTFVIERSRITNARLAVKASRLTGDQEASIFMWMH